MKDERRLLSLITLYKQGTCSEQEYEELKNILESASEEELVESYNELPNDLNLAYSEENQDQILNKIWKDPRIDSLTRIINISLLKRLAVAVAAIFFLVGISVLLYKNNFDSQFVNDDHISGRVIPGYDRARIISEDGSELLLDSLSHPKELKSYGLVRLKDNNGQYYFKYSSSDKGLPNKFHTVSTPKGGQLRLELPDGTQVWLNSASSIRFAYSFSNDSRVVYTDGEVYFEVQSLTYKGEKMPFKVFTKGQQIEVLGTSFNVNSYKTAIVTTLVEGKVSVKHSQNKKVFSLLPNQQSVWDKDFKITNVDPSYAIAWKDGDFAFFKSSIEEVMLNIGRWYDVEIEYKGNFDQDIFTGTISRYEDIDKLLATMELTGSFKFIREGRKIIVYKSI